MSKKRSSYDKNLFCNQYEIYKDDMAWEKDFKQILDDLKKYERFKGHILDNPNSLYELLELDTLISRTLSKMICYAQINYDTDTSISKYQAMWNKTLKLIGKYEESTSFIIPELIEKDYNIVKNYISIEPRLKDYEKKLQDIYKIRKHTLSKECEQLLSTYENSLNSALETYEYLIDTDLKFGTIKDENGVEVELSEKTYNKLITSKDKNTRRVTFEKFYEVYGDFKNTFSKLLETEVSNRERLAKIRNYDNALEESLYLNEVPIAIYDKLLEVVHQNLYRLKKYFQLRKKALGLEELHLYDLRVTLSKNKEPNYTFEEAKNVIKNSLSILGKEYCETLDKAFVSRWIDAADNDNKRNIAYCAACYDVHPYVSVPFDETLSNVFDIAHEMGHAIHEYYSSKSQLYQNSMPTVFVSEVASQINEIFLNVYLLEHTDDRDFKITLLDKLLEHFRNAVYRQTMFAEFEKEIHELAIKDIPLTQEVLCEKYYRLNKMYFNGEIKVDDMIKYEWVRIPHFYDAFYVYQYATSYIAAIVISKKILSGDKNAIKDYLEFLKLGSSLSPIESLKVAGVDMEDPEVLENAFNYYEDLINELEEILRCKNG